jgi:rhodanese-related sulfurtransferase
LTVICRVRRCSLIAAAALKARRSMVYSGVGLVRAYQPRMLMMA